MLELDGEALTESGSIVHRLLSRYAVSGVESQAGRHSVFWTHFSEGTLMSMLHASSVVASTGGAWSKGIMGGLGEEGRDAVGKYSQWLLVPLLPKKRKGRR